MRKRLREILILIFLLAGCMIHVLAQGKVKPMLLEPGQFRHYVEYFNRMEDENIRQAIPNDSAWSWMSKNIPLFTCPQQNFEEIYYYRWWTLRKHIKKTDQGFVFTEFLVPRSYADKYNLISSGLGHHIYESRWLHNQRYVDDYLHIWYRGNGGKPLNKLRFYSSWNMDAIYNRFLVNRDTAFILDLLPDLLEDYTAWERERRLPNGLYWQYDVRDAMEETISGGRREKNARPSINGYMYGNAKALAAMVGLAGKEEQAEQFLRKSDSLRSRLQENLWHEGHGFFEVRKESDTLAHVMEAIGFIPWYFNMPAESFGKAWDRLTESKTFDAPFGLTTADRSHPGFRTHGCCNCEWDGAVWPFATSQTLTALANLLNNYRQHGMNDSIYFKQLERFTESQYYRGRPYIGEYLDETTGYWLKGDAERSRYYNHSTYNDLLITGLVGLRPRADDLVEVNPLLPENRWDWFCLDNVLYHGKMLTIVWDRDGSRFKKGKGLSVWANGKKIAGADRLQRVTGKL